SFAPVSPFAAPACVAVVFDTVAAAVTSVTAATSAVLVAATKVSNVSAMLIGFDGVSNSRSLCRAANCRNLSRKYGITSSRSARTYGGIVHEEIRTQRSTIKLKNGIATAVLYNASLLLHRAPGAHLTPALRAPVQQRHQQI
ncbi:hypothetical protein Vafri_5847, partial [Volvox africanus]